MLDVTNNLDTVNFIVQEAIKGVLQTKLQPKNNLYCTEFFSVHMQQPKKKQVHLRVSNSTAANICRIYVDEKECIVRYSHELMFGYDSKKSKYWTNVLESAFDLDDISAAFFTQSTVLKFDKDFDFDYDIMTETLNLCRDLHVKFIHYFEQIT